MGATDEMNVVGNGTMMLFSRPDANGVLVIAGTKESVDPLDRNLGFPATKWRGTETPVSNKFFSESDPTLSRILVALISVTGTGALEACLMKHGESATNVSPLDELPPKVTIEKGLLDRVIIPKPFPNRTPLREDI